MSTSPTRRQRAIAGLVDTALVAALLLAYTRSRRKREERPSPDVSAVIATTYLVVPVAVFGGTPGQLVAGLRVIDTATRRRVGWRQASLRWILWSGPAFVINAASRRMRADRATSWLPFAGLIASTFYRRKLGEGGVDRVTRSKVVSIR